MNEMENKKSPIRVWRQSRTTIRHCIYIMVCLQACTIVLQSQVFFYIYLILLFIGKHYCVATELWHRPAGVGVQRDR